MNNPDADHPITIEPGGKRVVVEHGGRVVADTRRALALAEASYPVVYYIPREDVDMSLLTRTTHTSHCPYKGDASYYSVEVEGFATENAAWSYEAPYDAVAAIKDCLAFYPQRVDRISETA